MIRHRLHPPGAREVEYFARIGSVTRACLRLRRLLPVYKRQCSLTLRWCATGRPWPCVVAPATGPVELVGSTAEISGESAPPGLVTYAAPARTARRRGLLPPDLCADPVRGVTGRGDNSVNGG